MNAKVCSWIGILDISIRPWMQHLYLALKSKWRIINFQIDTIGASTKTLEFEVQWPWPQVRGQVYWKSCECDNSRRKSPRMFKLIALTCDVDGLTCVTAHPCQEKCKTPFAVRSSLVALLSVINEAALSHVYPLNRGSCCFLILQVCNKLRRKTSANSWKQEGKRHLPLV